MGLRAPAPDHPPFLDPSPAPPGEAGNGDVEVLQESRLVSLGRALWPHLPALFVVLLYAGHFARLSVDIHRGYGSGAFDLGIFDQGVWLLSRFQTPFVTIIGRNLFADHASFILIPLVPLYWLRPDPETLLVVHSVAIAAAGIPIYLLALHCLRSRWMALVMLACFLLHPALQWGTLENFHPEGFLVLFAATALYAAVTWKPPLLVASVVLSLLVKEDVVLFVLPLALWVGLRRNRVMGERLALGSVAYAVVVTAGVMRALGGGPASIYASRTFPFGGLRGMLSTTLHQPGEVFDFLRGDGRPFYVWQMLFPSAFVFLRAPSVLAVALPVLGFNVASAWAYQHSILYHYSLVLVPVVAAGTVYGIGALVTAWARRVAITAVALCSLWSGVLWGAYPIADKKVPHRSPQDPAVARIAAVQAALPPTAVVSAHYNFVPHIAHRTAVYMWPNPFRASYWGLLDQEGQRLPAARNVRYLMLPPELSDEDQTTMDAIRSDFVVVRRNADAVLYRRK